MKKIVVILLCFIVVTTFSGCAMIPGAAQIRNEKYIKGGLFIAGVVIPTMIAQQMGYDTENPLKGADYVQGISSVIYLWNIIDGINETVDYNRKINEQHINNILTSQSFSEKEKTAIFNNQIYIGMGIEAFVEVMGNPNRINRTVTSSSVSKQYVYVYPVKDKYFYFTNGLLQSWQD